MIKQQVLLDQDRVKLKKLETKKEEVAHQITVNSQLKKEVQEKLDKLALEGLKIIEEAFRNKSQDTNIGKAAKLKVIVDRSN